MPRPFRSPPPLLALAALAVLGGSLLSSTPAAGTTVLRLDDDQLVDQSTLVVTGTCEAVRTEWRDRTLVTLATIRVDRVLKGDPVAEVTVVIPGGIDLDREVPVAVNVPGAPSILPRERALLFLGPTGFGVRPRPRAATGGGAPELAITGFFQGKLPILVGPGGEPVVRRDLAGAALPKGHRLGAAGARAVPLALFEERIARRAAAGPDEPRNREETRP